MIKKTKALPIANLLLFVIMIIVNVLAMTNLLGNSTREISSALVTLLMPLGITFSIVWTIIYALLAASTIYSIVRSDEESVKSINIYYMFTSLLNILWVIAFHAKMYLISLAIIIVLNLVLFLIVNKLKYGNDLLKTTFSVYYAWITVAMFVSIFSYISSVDPFSYNSVVIRLLVVAAITLLTILTLMRVNNYAYTATIVLAELGILFKHLIDFNGIYSEIIIAVSVSLLVLISLTVLSISKKAVRYEAV